MSLPGGGSEEFRATWRQTWHTHIKPFLISNILIAVVAWVLGYVFGGPVVSVLPPVVLVGLITLLQRVASRGHGLRLSADGVEFLRRDGVVVRMRWADIRGIAVLDQRRTGVIAPYGVARAAAAADSAAFAAANTGDGLVGIGEVLTPAQAAQQRQAGPAWQPLGKTGAASLRLAVVDREWRTGRIGEWFRAYRPDLMPG
ncbi:hypothetical protein Drose_12140 [Dactylosporangium roseum]|uniref:PH domain-containing protein n=1 Tax=Dactylosporangium roseum TaxID=47989 RepID=A0ABY5ZB52_9ACTN|nr:hypothetical protein [Dactylosporangium roseum]UWZ38899.1 hypothetical protein Drose_12140 [Dactylosporangium roseum]